MVKGRKLVPLPAKQAGKPGNQKRKKAPNPSRLPLSAAEKAYARLLYDPCNAPIQLGMVADGYGTNVQRFSYDFAVLTGATDTSMTLCISPSNLFIKHGFQSSDTANITFSSAYPFPGSGVISANARRYRCLAACAQITWVGAEQSRQGILAMGNAPDYASSTTGATPSEVRSSLGYVTRIPDQTVGIKWRPSEFDLDWTINNNATSNRNAIWLQAAGLPVSTTMRIRVVAVMEWDVDVGLNTGVPIPQYPPATQSNPNTLERALSWLDKQGHWLLDNGKAIGHVVAAGVQLLTG